MSFFFFSQIWVSVIINNIKRSKHTSKHLSCHRLANISSWGEIKFPGPTNSGSNTQCSAANRLHPCLICDCCIIQASAESSSLLVSAVLSGSEDRIPNIPCWFLQIYHMKEVNMCEQMVTIFFFTKSRRYSYKEQIHLKVSTCLKNLSQALKKLVWGQFFSWIDTRMIFLDKEFASNFIMWLLSLEGFCSLCE